MTEALASLLPKVAGKISLFTSPHFREMVADLKSAKPYFFRYDRDKEGKQKAVDVIRPGSPPLRSQSIRKPRTYKKRRGFSPLLSLVVILVIIGFALVRQYGPTETLSKLGVGQRAGNVTRDADQETPSNYQCDGRTYCSEMTSCEEAKYFLKHCPDVKMDGNHDGIPCEQQWCTGFFGN